MIEDSKSLFDNSDLTFAKYKILGDFWKEQDKFCVWGGDFKFARDIYHFELKEK